MVRCENVVVPESVYCSTNERPGRRCKINIFVGHSDDLPNKRYSRGLCQVKQSASRKKSTVEWSDIPSRWFHRVGRGGTIGRDEKKYP